MAHLFFGVAVIQHVAVNSCVGVGVTTWFTTHAMAILRSEDQITEHTYCPKWYVSCTIALYVEQMRASHVLNCSRSMKHVIRVVPTLRLIRNAVERVVVICQGRDLSNGDKVAAFIGEEE